MPEAFLDLAQNLIDYVDEKYGRFAAWLVALAIVGVPAALMLGAIAYFLSGS